MHPDRPDVQYLTGRGNIGSDPGRTSLLMMIAPEIEGVAEQLISGMGEINITKDITGAEGGSGGKGKEVVRPADYVFE